MLRVARRLASEGAPNPAPGAIASLFVWFVCLLVCSLACFTLPSVEVTLRLIGSGKGLSFECFATAGVVSAAGSLPVELLVRRTVLISTLLQ